MLLQSCLRDSFYEKDSDKQIRKLMTKALLWFVGILAVLAFLLIASAGANKMMHEHPILFTVIVTG